MKTKDLLYVGAIGLVAYLLYKNKNKTSSTTNPQLTNLEQPEHMDLPNLTPSTGVSTEVALGDLKSNCGDTFTVPSEVGNNYSTLYSTLKGLRFKQIQGFGIRAVKEKISEEEFNKACADYKSKFGGVRSLPVKTVKGLTEEIVNFSGTLYRGVM